MTKMASFDSYIKIFTFNKKDLEVDIEFSDLSSKGIFCLLDFYKV